MKIYANRSAKTILEFLDTGYWVYARYVNKNGFKDAPQYIYLFRYSDGTLGYIPLNFNLSYMVKDREAMYPSEVSGIETIVSDAKSKHGHPITSERAKQYVLETPVDILTNDELVEIAKGCPNMEDYESGDNDEDEEE